ncbi:MAG: ferrous iron transport protein B [Lawsonibacter sp.]|nr:ferrous iron transport protein B [Lawsonibacter sp.]
MNIKIALAGNPNCGKTTLFNALTGSTQYVGNWPGVTVERKEGRLKGRRDVVIQDLPGIYSLSPYTMEEVVARNYLVQERPDAVLNIVDGTNMERSLYLTTQLLELGLPVVVAVNMMDLVEKQGGRIDIKGLGEALGCPVVELSALKNRGIEEAVTLVLAAARGPVPQSRPTFQVDEAALEEGDDLESATAAARYDFIQGITARTVEKRGAGELSLSDRIDQVVTNRLLALPIFVGVMLLVYGIAMGGWSISVGTAATNWANDTLFGVWVPALFDTVLSTLGVGEESWAYGLIQEGIVGGVGSVLGFVPQLLVLFLLLAVLEDVGYMARVAFIMDRIFRRFGLSGKSFIPMLVATGCGVPGIMASRTIEQDRDRKMTIMTTGFIPCGAKLPIIGLFAGALFGGSSLVAVSAFFIGVGAVIVSGVILKKSRAFAGEPAPFVMELPAYHAPSVQGVLRTAWERGWSFIKRAGTVILLSTIVLWFLQGYGFVDGALRPVEDNNSSLLAAIGSAVAWVFYPLGWTGDMAWKAAVATFTGLIAKEEVVNTFGVLYHYGGGVDLMEDSSPIWALVAADFTPLSAYSFMIFNLLCAPCFAAIGAIRREMNSPAWTAAAIGYMCGFAYLIAMIVYQVGGLITGEAAFGPLSAAALALLAGLVYLLLRKGRRGGEQPRLAAAAT